MVKCRRDGAGTAERLSFPIFFGKCIAYSIRLCVVTGKTDIRQRFCFQHVRGVNAVLRLHSGRIRPFAAFSRVISKSIACGRRSSEFRLAEDRIPPRIRREPMRFAERRRA